MDARNDMPAIGCEACREGFTLPQPFYIDPGYFRLDMEMILVPGPGCSSDTIASSTSPAPS